MKQYLLPLIFCACASQTAITTKPQPTTNPAYQKMPEMVRINDQYTTLKESLAEIIVLSAIDQEVFNTTCITGEHPGIGQLRLTKNPCNSKNIEEILQNSLPKIDQDHNYFVTKEEITQFSNSIINRYCSITSNSTSE